MEKEVIKIKESQLKQMMLEYSIKMFKTQFGDNGPNFKQSIEKIQEKINNSTFVIENDELS